MKAGTLFYWQCMALSGGLINIWWVSKKTPIILEWSWLFICPYLQDWKLMWKQRLHYLVLYPSTSHRAVQSWNSVNSGWMDGNVDRWEGGWINGWMNSTLSRSHWKYKELNCAKLSLWVGIAWHGERLQVGKSVRKLLPVSPWALMLLEWEINGGGDRVQRHCQG